MGHHLVDTANVEKDLLWSWEEELLVARKPAGSRDFAWGLVRVAMYFAAVLSAIFGFPMLFKQINGFPSACSAVAGSFHKLILRFSGHRCHAGAKRPSLINSLFRAKF